MVTVCHGLLRSRVGVEFATRGHQRFHATGGEKKET